MTRLWNTFTPPIPAGFTIFQPDHGTSPTAIPGETTLTLTSSDASITITGTASTDTINFQFNKAAFGFGTGVDNHIVRWDGTSALQNTGWVIDDSDYMSASDASFNLTGNVNLTNTQIMLVRAQGSAALDSYAGYFLNSANPGASNYKYGIQITSSLTNQTSAGQTGLNINVNTYAGSTTTTAYGIYSQAFNVASTVTSQYAGYFISGGSSVVSLGTSVGIYCTASGGTINRALWAQGDILHDSGRARFAGSNSALSAVTIKNNFTAGSAGLDIHNAGFNGLNLYYADGLSTDVATMNFYRSAGTDSEAPVNTAGVFNISRIRFWNYDSGTYNLSGALLTGNYSTVNDLKFSFDCGTNTTLTIDPFQTTVTGDSVINGLLKATSSTNPHQIYYNTGATVSGQFPAATVALQNSASSVNDGYGPILNFSAYMPTPDALNLYGSLGFVRNGAETSGKFVLNVANSGSSTQRLSIDNAGLAILNGKLGLGNTSPVAYLTLPAGGTGANTAQVYFTSGSLLATPVAGTMEYDGSYFYLNPLGARLAVVTDNGTRLINTRVPYATTNGFLIDSANMTFAPSQLTLTGAVLYINTNSTTALKIEQSSNATLVLDTTNKRLGIGQAPGAYTLDLYRVSSSTDLGFRMTQQTSSTSSLGYMLTAKVLSTGSAANGLGAGIQFVMTDSSGATENVLARIGAQRSNSSNSTGDLLFTVPNAGTLNITLANTGANGRLYHQNATATFSSGGNFGTRQFNSLWDVSNNDGGFDLRYQLNGGGTTTRPVFLTSLTNGSFGSPSGLPNAQEFYLQSHGGHGNAINQSGALWRYVTTQAWSGTQRGTKVTLEVIAASTVTQNVVLTATGAGIAFGNITPTAYAHCAAGTATAGTAPLKFNSGTNLTAVEAGAMEFDGTQLYFSPSATRQALIQDNGTRLTSGRVPFAGTSGYLQDDSDMTFSVDTLTITKVSSGTVISTGVIRLKGYTVAGLPVGTQGDTAFVTDALAPTFLAVIVGGGAIVTPVFYNGTNWVGH